jgi:hypothetical protein
VVVGDDDIHAAGVAVVDGVVGGDAGVAGEDEFCAVVDDGSEGFDMNAVTLFSSDGDVIDDVRIQGAQGLHEQGGGGLPVHVEIAPDADAFLVADSQIDEVNCFFNAGEWR